MPKDACTEPRSVFNAIGIYQRRIHGDQGVDLRGEPHEATIPIDIREHLVKVGNAQPRSGVTAGHSFILFSHHEPNLVIVDDGITVARWRGATRVE